MTREYFVADPNEQYGAGRRSGVVKLSAFQIMAKLAVCNGFNTALNIKGRDGEFIPGTDVSKLLTLAVTPLEYVPGVDEFTDLLSRCGVTFVLTFRMKTSKEE